MGPHPCSNGLDLYFNQCAFNVEGTLTDSAEMCSTHCGKYLKKKIIEYKKAPEPGNGKEIHDKH